MARVAQGMYRLALTRMGDPDMRRFRPGAPTGWRPRRRDISEGIVFYRRSMKHEICKAHACESLGQKRDDEAVHDVSGALILQSQRGVGSCRRDRGREMEPESRQKTRHATSDVVGS